MTLIGVVCIVPAFPLPRPACPETGTVNFLPYPLPPPPLTPTPAFPIPIGGDGGDLTGDQ